jgi:hypothetical protein
MLEINTATITNRKNANGLSMNCLTKMKPGRSPDKIFSKPHT